MEYNEPSLKDKIILANINDIPKVLKEIKDDENISINGIKRKLGIGINKATSLRNTVCNMKLVVKIDNKLHISELGNKWLNYYQMNEKIPENIIKEATLNVPVFKEVYKTLPYIRDKDLVHKKMAEEIFKIDKKIDSKIIGSATRRYLEGVYGIKLLVYERWKNKLNNVNNNKNNNLDDPLKMFINHYKLNTREKSTKFIQFLLSILNEEDKRKILKPAIDYYIK